VGYFLEGVLPKRMCGKAPHVASDNDRKEEEYEQSPREHIKSLGDEVNGPGEFSL